MHTIILFRKQMSSNLSKSTHNNSKQREPENENPSSPTKRGFQDQAEFEKNYPKNIFIPLIEYIGELGYREACEQSVGKRTEYEGKNVVSLGLIHQLISQDWFLRNVNRQLALRHISNKILLNSKIKKKLFHLLIAELIFTCDFADSKDFRRRVSKQANSISRRLLPEDSLFTYPNAIIYLLHLFRRILLSHASKKNFNKLQEDFEKMSIEQVNPEVKVKILSSKEEYKFYVKQIVHIFGSKSIGSQTYTDILEEVRQTIHEKDKCFRQKYKLVEGIPNWAHFLECVVMRCFQYRKKDHKLTNFLFNQWISEAKSKMLNTKNAESKEGRQYQKGKETERWQGLELHDKWSAVPLTLIPTDDSEPPKAVGVKTDSAVVKKFSPIILANIGQ